MSKKLNLGAFTQNLFASGVAITQLQRSSPTSSAAAGR